MIIICVPKIETPYRPHPATQSCPKGCLLARRYSCGTKAYLNLNSCLIFYYNKKKEEDIYHPKKNAEDVSLSPLNELNPLSF